MAVCQIVASIIRLARCVDLTCAKPESSRYHITGCVIINVSQSTELGERRRLLLLCVVSSWWKVIIPSENFSRRCWVLAYLQSRRRERKRGGVCECDPLPHNTPVDFESPGKVAVHTKMPADVAMAGCSTFLQDPVADNAYWNPEAMSGSMTLVGPGKHCQSVQVKVYRTSLEHFAVLYPQKKVCRPLGVLNLRNTCVERLPGGKQPGFIVRQRGFDTPMCLTFLSESPRDLESWVLAFTSRSSPTVHQSSLPIVEEDEEV